MTGSETFSSLTRQAIEQHQQIHFFLDQLARSLSGLEPSHADVGTIKRLAAQIEGLRERLQEHFESEEDGGLFRAVVENLPEAHAETQKLAQEHRSVLEMLDTARVRAEHGQVTDANLLRTDLEGFLETLRRHEHREEALFARALEREAHRGVPI
jgi:hemerythrin-like domain-containing protein